MRNSYLCANALYEGNRKRLRTTGKNDLWVLVKGDSTSFIGFVYRFLRYMRIFRFDGGFADGI